MEPSIYFVVRIGRRQIPMTYHDKMIENLELVSMLN